MRYAIASRLKTSEYHNKVAQLQFKGEVDNIKKHVSSQFVNFA